MNDFKDQAGHQRMRFETRSKDISLISPPPDLKGKARKRYDTNEFPKFSRLIKAD